MPLGTSGPRLMSRIATPQWSARSPRAIRSWWLADAMAFAREDRPHEIDEGGAQIIVVVEKQHVAGRVP